MPTFENKRVLSLKGTTAEWAANDITPADGEICIEDLGGGAMKLKVGNGVGAFSTLQYVRGWTQAEIESIVDARIATFGVAVSAGAPDAGKLVRLDGSGLIHDSMIPAVPGTYLGHLNARDNDVDTELGAGFTFTEGDWFIMTRDGTYDASWPGVGGTAGHDADLCMYQGGAVAAFEIVNKTRNDATYVAI